MHLREAKASHSHKMWTEVSSSVPHFLKYVLWVQKRNPDMLPFSLKEFRQVNPLQVPQWGPYGEKYLLQGIFTSHLVYVFLSFPQSPQ